jgi:hypothetical protein
MADDKAAADKRMAEDKKRLAEERDKRQKDREEHLKRTRGTPTPTQEECDLLKLGHHVEIAKDGSAEDPNVGFTQKQLVGSGHGSGYETRQMGAEPASRSAPAKHSS